MGFFILFIYKVLKEHELRNQCPLYTLILVVGGYQFCYVYSLNKSYFYKGGFLGFFSYVLKNKWCVLGTTSSVSESVDKDLDNQINTVWWFQNPFQQLQTNKMLDIGTCIITLNLIIYTDLPFSSIRVQHLPGWVVIYSCGQEEI